MISQAEMIDFTKTQTSARQLSLATAKDGEVATTLWDQGDTAFLSPQMDFHLLELVHRGSHRGAFRLDGAGRSLDFRFGENSVQYYAPGQRLCFEAEGAAHFQQVLIDRRYFDSAARAMGRDGLELETSPSMIGYFDPVVSDAMRRLLIEAQAPSARGQMMIDALVQQIVVAILRRVIGDKAAPQRTRTLSRAELDRAMELIEDQIEENIGLEAVAATLGMPPHVFARAFKATVGTAPHQYLIKRRIARAQDLLVDTREPLAEVAYSCGFASQAHMTNVFSKRLGITPGKYRQERTR